MVQPTIDLDPFDHPPPEEKSHGGCAGCGTGSALAALTKCGNGLEKIYPTTAVRFGYMRYIGEFTHLPEMRFTCGAKVVIQTKRGIEIGEQVSLTCNGCEKAVTRDQMKDWVARCGEDSYIFDAGRILREATAADLAEYSRIQASVREKIQLCQEVASRRGLPIRIVECESPFGGERLIFFFTAPERVDFRAIVKDLAREYRTRIEMRQIGARDEARLLADYETCGREVCCKVFLKTLRPISMRMAKVQKATLDPSQVSGRCGRLKCCLRYEHVGYEELDKLLPKTGTRIRTTHGDGVIVNRQILTQLVQMRTEGDKLVTVVAEDILELNPTTPRPAAPSPDPTEAKTDGKARGAKREPDRAARRSRRRSPTKPKGDDKPDDAVDSPDQPGAADASAESSDGDQSSPSRRRRGRRRRGRRRRGPSDGGAAGSEPAGGD